MRAIIAAALLLLAGTALSAPKDDLKDIRKNKKGWQQYQVWRNGEPIEVRWGYQKANGKWKVVKIKDGEWTSKDDADSLKGGR